MSITLNCAVCGRPLTNQLWLAPPKEHRPYGMDREAAVPRGLLVRLEREDTSPVMRSGQVVRTHIYSPAGALAANPDDVVRERIVSTVDNDHGCCGSDGMDGPNRRCRCGALLATEWSDCWTRAEVRFLPSAVVVEDDMGFGQRPQPLVP